MNTDGHGLLVTGSVESMPVRLFCALRRYASQLRTFHPCSSVFIRGFMLCALMCATGCHTERVVSSDGRPLPDRPRAAPIAPQAARANRMSFLVGAKPQDTNRNGYPDRIETEIMLFAWPHPTPIREKGEFHFRLFAQGEAFDEAAQPVAEWRVSGDAVRAAEGVAMAGPCYRFHLSLLDRGAGGDLFPLTAADLRATFIPAEDGPPIQNDGVRSIQIGRR